MRFSFYHSVGKIVTWLTTQDYQLLESEFHSIKPFAAEFVSVPDSSLSPRGIMIRKLCKSLIDIELEIANCLTEGRPFELPCEGEVKQLRDYANWKLKQFQEA